MSRKGKRRRRRNRRVEAAVSLALGTLCALALGAMFYGVMAYRSGDEAVLAAAREAQTPAATAAPLEQGADMRSLFPGRLLALGEGTLENERAEDMYMGGAMCRVVTRTYTLGDGSQAEAISASPAAYIERMAAQGYTPALMTGFELAGMNAVYATRGEECLMIASEGDCAYMLHMRDEQSMAYAVGAGANLEE